jgi:hypothetical protein
VHNIETRNFVKIAFDTASRPSKEKVINNLTKLVVADESGSSLHRTHYWFVVCASPIEWVCFPKIFNVPLVDWVTFFFTTPSASKKTEGAIYFKFWGPYPTRDSVVNFFARPRGLLFGESSTYTCIFLKRSTVKKFVRYEENLIVASFACAQQCDPFCRQTQLLTLVVMVVTFNLTKKSCHEFWIN